MYVMFLTEDSLIDWVESQGGLLVTRRTLNIETFDFANAPDNTLVCITGYPHLIRQFFGHTIHQFPRSVIVLFVESDEVAIDPSWLSNLKLKHCFTWNLPFFHPKLSALPIGLNHNRQYAALTEWLSRNSGDPPTKQWLCINHSPETNPVRAPLQQKAITEWSSFCSVIGFIPPVKSYLIPSHIEGQIRITETDPRCYDEWRKHRFVLSPPGAGIDCHRTWEAIAVGCIPIVLSSNLNELYTDLPVLVVESWNQINAEYLAEQYDIIEQRRAEGGYRFEKLTLEYWTERIRNVSQYPQKIHLITYGNDKFAKSKARLIAEAHGFGEFASITGYGPENLTPEFRETYKPIMEQPRGGGYWIWRPVIIQHALSFINENDLLVYLDAGCSLNPQGKPRFFEYIHMLNTSPEQYGVLSFQMTGNNGPGGLAVEKHWTTKQIFNYLGVDIDSEIANSGQHLCTVLVFKKNDHLKQYMERYTNTILSNPWLCTDLYNRQGQIPEFRDNRHEQSIVSVLLKQMGSVVIDGDESWMVPFGKGESLKYPFWATRIRG